MDLRSFDLELSQQSTVHGKHSTLSVFRKKGRDAYYEHFIAIAFI